MNSIIIYSLLIKLLSCAQQSVSTKRFEYGQYGYNETAVVIVNNETEQILDFYEAPDQGYPTRVEVSTNSSVSLDYPVFITATQQKGISSWELPIVDETNKNILFYDMARTLCPHDAGPYIRLEHRATVHVSTDSAHDTSVAVRLTRVRHFYVELNKTVSVAVSPSTPQYFFFSFDQNPWNVSSHLRGMPGFNYTIPKSVIVIVESEDELCATVSIQNNTCPVLDSERELLFQGYHLTMTTKGGITLTQSMFPLGFYVVLAVKENDAPCTGESETDTPDTPRLKNFKFSIIATVSYAQYAVGAVVVLALTMLVAAFVVLAALPYSTMLREEVSIEREAIPSTSRDVDGPLLDDDEQTAADACAPLTVARLSQAHPHSLAKRSHRYFWGALTIAVVYSLPVVQLLVTYQQMVFQTGNQDLCYYNFLCAHPAGRLADYNHVFSNASYVLLGLVFMAQVRARQVRGGRRGQGQGGQDGQERQEVGIPPHFGLLYTLGLSLCMEGFLSACYHLCPNKMNFQFDSSFMLVTAVVVMLKLYQNRHSDLLPDAHATFMLLAVIMTLGVVGILCAGVVMSVVFTTLHMTACVVFTLKIYYAGSFHIMDVSALVSACRGVWRRGCAWPAHRARALLLALANVANVTFAIYTAYIGNTDFARQLLAILMGNAVLYTLFYVAMKLVHRERLAAHTWLYVACAHLAWPTAVYYFVNGNTRWSETPAMSRRRNAVCTSLQLFDNHDIWHVSSAAALFLSFNMLLTIDDPLAYTPRKDIATF